MPAAPISIPDHRDIVFKRQETKSARRMAKSVVGSFVLKGAYLGKLLACQEADQIEMVISHVDQDRMLQLKQRMIRLQDVRNILAKKDTDRLKRADFPALKRLTKNCDAVHEPIALADHHFSLAFFDHAGNMS